MRSRWFVATLLIGLSILVIQTALWARQQAGNPPGLPTPARIQVTNRGSDEAVPVVFQAGGDVQPVAIVTAPALSLAPNSHVSTEARSQRWEYRMVSAKPGEDLVSILDKAGAEGWEAVGVLPVAGSVETRVLLKRPR